MTRLKIGQIVSCYNDLFWLCKITKIDGDEITVNWYEKQANTSLFVLQKDETDIIHKQSMLVQFDPSVNFKQMNENQIKLSDIDMKSLYQSVTLTSNNKLKQLQLVDDEQQTQESTTSLHPVLIDAIEQQSRRIQVKINNMEKEIKDIQERNELLTKTLKEFRMAIINEIPMSIDTHLTCLTKLLPNMDDAEKPELTKHLIASTIGCSTGEYKSLISFTNELLNGMDIKFFFQHTFTQGGKGGSGIPVHPPRSPQIRLNILPRKQHNPVPKTEQSESRNRTIVFPKQNSPVLLLKEFPG
ncbi:unnamed protein product [Didymodactylos carnosus]|uniref:Uncharacterized protein n=1 Tax=Didymodactylos carnosus TaxID=1234261 RepID=A0A814YGZ8_9BILA|nr:unnamed protein product [Didymodactylos carnosus]CAF3992462.1 unnamed protein product [Didymodactylos carnosus]